MAKKFEKKPNFHIKIFWTLPISRKQNRKIANIWQNGCHNCIFGCTTTSTPGFDRFFFLAVINSLFQSISRYFIKYSNFIHPIQSTPSRPVKWTYCKDKQKDIYILNAKHDTAWKHLQLPWIIFNGHNLLNIFPVNMISSGPNKMFSYFRMKSTRYGRQNLQWKTNE